MFDFFKPRKPVKAVGELVTNPRVFPARDGSVHMALELRFANGGDARAFLEQNGLPVVVFDRG